MIVSLVIPGEPAVKERPRCGRNGARSTERQKQAEREIGRLLQERYIVPEAYTGMVSLKLLFYTASERKDWDNMAKLFCDALNGTLWADDRQVKEVTVAVLPIDQKGARTVARVMLWEGADVIARGEA